MADIRNGLKGESSESASKASAKAKIILSRSKREIQKRPFKPIFKSRVGELSYYLADITFMPSAHSSAMKRANKGYTNMLTAIESGTRYMYVKPMKTKTAIEVAETMRDIILETYEDDSCITNLITDDGKEFVNNTFSSLMQDYEIEHEIKHSDDKYRLSIVNIWHRYLKQWLYEEMIDKDTLDWVSQLPTVVQRINEHINTNLGYSAQDIRDDIHDTNDETRGLYYNEIKELECERGQKGMDDIKRIKVGARVRIREYKEPLSSGPRARQKWSNEVYAVTEQVGTRFRLINEDGDAAIV